MNLVRCARLLLLVFWCGPLLQAQHSFFRTRNAYLGQVPPGSDPKLFAPGMLTDKGFFVMGRVAFSRDGKDFYFTENDSWTSGAHSKLMTVHFAHGKWSAPTVLAEQFLSPTLSMDGKTLYMRKGGMNNVWRSNRNSHVWSTPVPLLQGGVGVYDFMPTLSGNIYVGSEPDSDDIKAGITYSFSVLTLSEGKPAVKSLGRPLNEPGFNGDLYVAPDESYMIISAHETKEYQSELYISFRKPDHTWTRPKSLGDKVNNGLAHRWGQYVTPDGKYLFYCWGTSEKNCGVYWVRFDRLLKTLRPKKL